MSHQPTGPSSSLLGPGRFTRAPKGCCLDPPRGPLEKAASETTASLLRPHRNDPQRCGRSLRRRWGRGSGSRSGSRMSPPTPRSRRRWPDDAIPVLGVSAHVRALMSVHFQIYFPLNVPRFPDSGKNMYVFPLTVVFLRQKNYAMCVTGWGEGATTCSNWMVLVAQIIAKRALPTGGPIQWCGDWSLTDPRRRGWVLEADDGWDPARGDPP